MTPEVLQKAFRCDRYGLIPVRGCLRRQLDRQEGAKPGHLGPPRRPFCAENCLQGAQHRAAARDEGVPLEACSACGSALVGADAHPCATCAARRLDAGKDVPRGELPTGTEPSSRIWTGEVPDVPISAPGARRGGGLLAARGGAGPSAALREKREKRAAERRSEFMQEQDHQEEPAEPEEEKAMPRGKREKPWPCCGSRSHRHMKGCKKAGGAGGPPVEVPGTRKPGVALAAAPVARRTAPARRAKATEEPDFGYLAEETPEALDDALRRIDATRAAILAEVERRAAQLDRLRERLRAAEAA